MKKIYHCILLLLLANTIANAQVCTPANVASYSKCCSHGVNRFQVGANTLFDSSSYSATSSYTDGYDSISTTMEAGTKYTFYLKASAATASTVCIWVDWNKNDTFEFGEITYYKKKLGTNMVDTISFTPLICGDSFRVRVLADYFQQYIGGITTLDPCKVYYGDFFDFKLYTVPSNNLDVSLVELGTLSSFLVGNNTLKIKLRNLSNTTVDSVRVYYQANGGNIVGEDITGMALGACAEYSHTFASQLSLDPTAYYIKSWVKYPNGTDPDSNPENDTSFISGNPVLGGNYTIDQTKATAGSNFQNFSAAVAALQAYGVSAPVVFTVAPGTYNDSFVLGSVNGASATNTITFDGVDTGTRTIRTLGYQNNVITLKSASYICIKNLTIRANLVASDIELEDSCGYILIDSCNFGGSTYASGTDYGVHFKGGQGAQVHHLTVSNCTFKDINYAIWLSTGTKIGYKNVLIRNTVFVRSIGIWLEGQDSMFVSENKILGGLGSGDGMICKFGKENVYSRNYFMSNVSLAFSLYYQKNALVINNIVTSGPRTGYCFAMGYCTKGRVYHNTFANFIGSAAAIGKGSGCDMRNNILYTAGNKYGLCLSAVEPKQFDKLDYNVYFSVNKSYKFVELEMGYYNDFASLKGQNGFNIHSTDTKPPFVDTAASTRDLHLLTNMLPSYGDSTLGVAYDFDDDYRCKIAPTIGADESKYFDIVSDFTSPDTAYLNSPVLFSNKGNLVQGKSFEWYVDGDTVPTYTTQDIWHTFTTLGTHTVRLKTTNCNGSHDTTKTVIIANPTKAPIVYFSADVVSIDMNEQVQFTDSSIYGPTSWHWSIAGGTGQGLGNDYAYAIGDSTSQHPKVEFYSQGLYEICLTATNSIGSNKLCKTAYIRVSPFATMCVTTITHDSAGHFYDPGGKLGKIPNQTVACDLLINPCSGPVTLTFDKVNVDTTQGWQQMTIYDGFDATGKLLNAHFIKTGDVFTAQSGHMLIHWHDTLWGLHTGWEASWTTQYKFVAKVPTIIKNVDTTYSYGTEHFEVSNFQKGAVYEWDCNNDGTIDFQGSSGDYTFGSAGTYTCICYTTNCGGLDSVISKVVVVDPTLPPKPVQFVVDVTNGNACKLKPKKYWSVDQYASVTLMDISGMVPTAWKWEVIAANPANYTWHNGDTIKNPTITFSVLGSYSIVLTVSNVAGTSVDTFYNVIKVVPTHCTPTVSNPITGYWGISEFSFNDIYQASSWKTGYSSYAGSPISCVVTGHKYGFSMKRLNTAQNAQTAIWIDYNQDGDFNDVGELVISNATLTTLAWADSIKIPKFSNNVLWGLTVLRVGITDPTTPFKVCGTNARGEFEDYSIYLTDDGVPPIITLLGKDTVQTEQGLTYKDPGARAYDLVDGFVPTTSANNIDKYTLGYYWERYDAEDKDLNKAIPVYRVVEVTPDKSAPTIALLGNNPYRQEVNTFFTDPWATAYDSLDGNINNITTKGSVNTAVLGSYKIWYYAADKRGNMDSVMRTVIVQDTTAPFLSLLGPDTVYLPVLRQYIEPGWTVSDNYDPFPKVTVNPGHIDSSILQSITLTYTATDSSGNFATKTRVVIIEDKVAPVVKLIGGDTVYVEVKTAYNEQGVVVTDNYWPLVNVDISGGPVDTNVLGTYILTYTAMDSSGNNASVNRVVMVQKTTKPTIYLNGKDTVYLLVGQTYTDFGVNSIADAYYSSSSLMAVLQTSSTFANPATATGTYYTWYYVTDPSNNSDTATRTFIVDANGIRSVNELSPITLWPNPATNLLNISGLNKGVNIVILYDAAGKQVLTETIKGENGALNTVGLSAGIYILKSVNNGKLSIARFEVVR